LGHAQGEPKLPGGESGADQPGQMQDKAVNRSKQAVSGGRQYLEYFVRWQRMIGMTDQAQPQLGRIDIAQQRMPQDFLCRREIEIGEQALDDSKEGNRYCLSMRLDIEILRCKQRHFFVRKMLTKQHKITRRRCKPCQIRKKTVLIRISQP